MVVSWWLPRIHLAAGGSIARKPCKRRAQLTRLHACAIWMSSRTSCRVIRRQTAHVLHRPHRWLMGREVRAIHLRGASLCRQWAARIVCTSRRASTSERFCRVPLRLSARLHKPARGAASNLVTMASCRTPSHPSGPAMHECWEVLRCSRPQPRPVLQNVGDAPKGCRMSEGQEEASIPGAKTLQVVAPHYVQPRCAHAKHRCRQRHQRKVA